MHPELDFKTLRAQVEAATRLPDFAELWRRARRVRIRDRLAVVGAMFGTLAVFAPVAIATVVGRPAYQVTPVGPDSGPIEQTPPTSTDQKLVVVVRAAAGVMSDQVFAAVDVCLDGATRRCNLQVAPLQVGTTGYTTGAPLAVNALRTSPTDRLDDVELMAMSMRTVLLSGAIGGKPRINLRVGMSGATTPDLPNSVLQLQSGDRAVQFDDAGDVYGVRQRDGALSLIEQQPPLGQRTFVTALSPEHGWWVTGVDQGTGAPAVAVSRDQGRLWTTRTLPAPAGQLDVPTVASYDGVTAYAFVRYSTGLRHFRTTDGGQHWSEINRHIQLPGLLAQDGGLAGRRFGAIARADGSVLLWIQDVAAPVFLNSTDGQNYGSYSGPLASVVTVDGGYVTLGERPELSIDCMNWAAATLPPPVQPN